MQFKITAMGLGGDLRTAMTSKRSTMAIQQRPESVDTINQERRDRTGQYRHISKQKAQQDLARASTKQCGETAYADLL